MAAETETPRYTPQQFSTAYVALIHMWHGLRHVDMDEVIRHVRQHNGHQFDAVGLANTEKLMEILESTKALRDTMKRVGVPSMPKGASQPRGASQPVRGGNGTA